MAEPSKQLTIRDEFEQLAPQFKAALPPHIPVERFIRIVMTAVNGDPALVQADRRSLFEAAMQCAQDGLLPDKREAAFVIYAGKVKYLPMVWGIVKKVRNSGELVSITSHVVHANDTFEYALGDDEGIKHTPQLNGDRGPAIMVYAIAKTRDGGIYRELLTADEVEAVKNISKAKTSGPWAGPFVLEMWRKTAIRRLSKRLPMSTDIEQLFQRDDDLYDLNKAHEPAMPRERAVVDPTSDSKLMDQLGEDQRREAEEKAGRDESSSEHQKEQPEVVQTEPKQTEPDGPTAAQADEILGKKHYAERSESKPETKKGKPKETAVTVEYLVAHIESATPQNWDSIKQRCREKLKDLKTSAEQLEVTRAMNRKNAEIYPL